VNNLKARGRLEDDGCLLLSESLHLIMPYHKRIDIAREAKSGERKIGTTGRGIGPCYEDKIARRGVRLMDLLDKDRFAQKLRENLEERNFILEKYLGEQPFTFDEIYDQYAGFADILRRYAADTAMVLHQDIKAGKKVLFEGAQGTMLDIDYGTYPFVTSSSTCAGGACTGSGVGPRDIHEIIGISKAYVTRVGSGPFPTELEDEDGEKLRDAGREFGSTTGRPRRCGWFDAPVVRYAVRINGLTGIALTKLDVLSGFDKIKICTGYVCQGKIVEELPASLETFSDCRPIYEEMPGWSSDISSAKALSDLPIQARNYIKRLEDLVGCPIVLVSVGARREDTFLLKNPFE